MEPRYVQVPARLGVSSLASFAAELDAACADKTVSVIVLVGTDEVFSSGLDTDELLREPSRELRARSIAGYQHCLRTIRLGPKPTIAVVDAPAHGGGVGLVLATDLVIATERASFALPESLFGLMPAMVMPLALERMRPQLARLWALSAGSHGPEEALAAGVVDRLVTSSTLTQAVRRAVRELSRARPAGVALLRTFTARAAELSLVDALKEGGELTLEASFDPAVVRALSDYREYGVIDWTEEVSS